MIGRPTRMREFSFLSFFLSFFFFPRLSKLIKCKHDQISESNGSARSFCCILCWIIAHGTISQLVNIYASFCGKPVEDRQDVQPALSQVHLCTRPRCNLVAMAQSNRMAVARNDHVAMTQSDLLALAQSDLVAMAQSDHVAMTQSDLLALAQSDRGAMAKSDGCITDPMV